MTPYDLRRFLGTLAPDPSDIHILKPGAVLEKLAKQFRDDPSVPGRLASLCSFALRFGRMDALDPIIESEHWRMVPEGPLYQGRLRFLDAVAESPYEPASAVLEQADDDFTQAGFSENSAIRAEAAAGLARIRLFQSRTLEAKGILDKLITSFHKVDRGAAVGLLLFFADFPGTPRAVSRRCLRRAYRLTEKRPGAHSGSSNPRDLPRQLCADAVLPIWISLRLGREYRAGKLMKTFEEAGNAEARFIRLLEIPGPSVENIERELELYKKDYPADARIWVLQGDRRDLENPEAARIAWREALVIDDRCADAWYRIGLLYKDAWERGLNEFGTSWLDSAADALLKAAGLDPLNGEFRNVLGMVDREAGRPDRAVAAFKGALALSGENRDTRRWLASAWMDMAIGDEADSVRSFAAERSRMEWDRVLSQGHPEVFDLIGMMRAIALSGREEHRLTSLWRRLSSEITIDDMTDITALAEELIGCGFVEAGYRMVRETGRLFGMSVELKSLKALVTEEENPAKAAELYAECIAESDGSEPHIVDWFLSAAYCHSAAGNPAQCEAVLQHGLRCFPGSTELLRELSERYVKDGREDEAAHLYIQAAAQSPKNYQILEDAAWFLRNRGRIDTAEKLLLNAVESVQPENPPDHLGRIWNQLGVHYMEIGWDESRGAVKTVELKKAVEAYRKAVECSPKQLTYAGNLGDALRQTGDWKTAREVLEDAVRNEDAFSLNVMGRIHDDQSYARKGQDSAVDDWTSSGDFYSRAAAASPDNPDFLKDYAWWLYRERRLEEAADLYRRAAQVDPDDMSLFIGLAGCLRELGNEHEAFRVLDEASRRHDSDPVIWADKGRILGELKRWDEAEDAFSHALDLSGNPSWVWMRVGQMRLERVLEHVDLKASADLFDEEFSLKHLLYLNMEIPGKDLQVDSMARAALEAWDEVCRLEERNPEALAGRACSLALLGKTAECVQILDGLSDKSAYLAQACNLLGRRFFMDRGHQPDTEHYLQMAARKMPADTEAAAAFHMDLGLFFADQERFEDALEEFRHAVDICPVDDISVSNAGLSALKLGRTAEAVFFLERALALGPANHYSALSAARQNALGVALVAEGQLGKAADAFRFAVLANPGMDEYSLNLKMVNGNRFKTDPSITLREQLKWKFF